MECITIDKTKVQVGDILQLVPMQEWESLNVKFADEEQQRRIAGQRVKVVKINNEDEDCLLYTCEELDGTRVCTELVDSDIEYIIRGN